MPADVARDSSAQRHSGGMASDDERHDIGSRADCERLVRAFYTRALEDPMIGWIFTDVAKVDLETHLPIVASFWETVLLGAGTYRGGTFAPHAAVHARVGLRGPHFAQWLDLWQTTVDEHFAGERAEAAKAHAVRVARAFHRRLNAMPPPPGAPDAAVPLGLAITRHG